MADAIVYCDRCGHIIPPTELARGTSLHNKNLAICTSCSAELSPEERALIAGPPEPKLGRRTPRPGGKPSSSRRLTPRPVSGRAPSGSNRTMFLVAGGVAGVLVGVALALMVLHGEDAGTRGTELAAPTASPTVAASATPGVETQGAGTEDRGSRDSEDAKNRLRELRSWHTPSFSRYDDLRMALTVFPKDHPGTPEMKGAAAFLAEIDAEYAKAADAALTLALEASARLLEEGKLGESARALASIRARFSQGTWLQDAGEPKMAGALGRIAEKRSAAASEAIQKAEAFLAKGDFAGVREAVRERSNWPEQERSRAAEMILQVERQEAKAASVAAADDPPDVAEVAEEAAPTGPRQGLVGEYFIGTDFDSEYVALRRLDARVDFDWGGGAPTGEIEADWFSVRWTGELEVPAEGKYVLRLSHHGGVTLRLDDKTLIDKRESGVDIASANLAKGWTPIQIEYVQTHGLAGCQLSMKGSEEEFKTVPAERLRAPEELLARMSGGDGGETLYKIPAGWVGTKVGSTDGNPYVVGGKPMWRVDRVWPDNPAIAANYVPLEWNDNSWFASKNTFDNCPKASYDGGTFYLRLCGPWAGGHDGFKIPALVFIAPATGQYAVSGVVFADVWQGAEPVKFRVAKINRATNTVKELAYHEIPPGKTPVKIDGVTTRLVEGEELAFIARFQAWHQAGACSFKALTISRRGLDTFEPPPPLASGEEGEMLPGEDGKPGQWAPGLVTEIFADQRLTERVGVRIDPHLDHYYGTAPPDLEMPDDGFAIRWSGWLLIPHDGQYQFEADGQKHFAVVLDGRQVVTGAGGRGFSGEIELTAGLHAISAVLHEGTGKAQARLLWKPPGLGAHTIPRHFFFHEVPQPGSIGPPAKLVSGLTAEFYSDERFARRVSTGLAWGPDFDSGKYPLSSACPNDGYSVRMKGYILIATGGTYGFELDTTGNARLTIDGDTVAEGSGKTSGKKALKAGYREIAIDYSEKNGDSKLGLNWDYPDDKVYVERVPHNVFFTTPPNAKPVDRRNTAPGMQGGFFTGKQPKGKPQLTYQAPGIDFYWDERPPAFEVPPDNFSAVWLGHLLVPQSGNYNFRAWVDDGLVVTIGNRQILNLWDDGAHWVDGSTPLRAGKVPIRVTYYENTGKAHLMLRWSGPTMAMRAVGGGDVGQPAVKVLVFEPPKPPLKSSVVAAAPPGEKQAPPPPPPAGGAKLPEGNLVGNGGFEDPGEGGAPAARWNSHQWGEGAAPYSIRSDRTNPHGGEKAVTVKSTGTGGKPGIFTPIQSLPPGRYELRFWACADVGSKAKVHADLAGEELGPVTVGEEYEQIKFDVVIREKKLSQSVRLYTSTPQVRVWFDDVEVEVKR